MKARIYYLDWQKAQMTLPRVSTRATMGAEPFPLASCYARVVEVEMATDDPELAANLLFEQYNVGDHGGRRDIRSMSCGDVVVADTDGGCVGLYCATCGWSRVDDALVADLEAL